MKKTRILVCESRRQVLSACLQIRVADRLLSYEDLLN